MTELHAMLDEHPDDWDTRLFLADWLEERGQINEAAYQRWAVERKKYPLHTISAMIDQPRSWDWQCYKDPDRFCDIPQTLFECLQVSYEPVQANFLEFYTRQDAEDALMAVLIEQGMIP